MAPMRQAASSRAVWTPGTSVEVGSVITVYIAADPSVEITAEPPAASDSDSESSASSGETPADDTQ